MVIYIDLIFLMNFLIDGALLLATAITRKIPVNPWRIVLGAGIGALYVVLIFFPQFSFLFTFVIKFGFSILMILATFGFHHLQQFLRNLGAFYVVNFVAAGGILGIHYLLLSSNDVMNGIWFTHSGGMGFELSIGLSFVVIAMAFVLWFYIRVVQGTKRKQEITTWIAEVTVYVDQFELTCRGLIDTGNQLYDPLTKVPVMVIESELWKAFLPAEWIKLIQKSEVDRILAGISEHNFIWHDRLRLVPYRGINKGMQFMLAIKPDRVVVQINEKKIESSKVLIGLDGGRLCSDGTYQAIIHPMLIEA